MKANAMVTFQDVSKTYRTSKGDEIQALKDIAFSVDDGQFVSFVGKSGCGKTTILKIAAGLVPHDDGSVVVNGSKVSGPLKWIGIVFQSPVLLDWRNTLDNILLPIELLQLRRNDYLSRVKELLTLTGMEGFEKNYPRELSGGMQQRISLCRALITDPPMLLMDEPFSALEAITKEEMIEELTRIWETNRKTVIFVTHDIAEAVFLSDRVFVMSKRPGTIIDIVDVKLARPRTVEIKENAGFIKYVKDIRKTLESNRKVFS